MLGVVIAIISGRGAKLVEVPAAPKARQGKARARRFRLRPGNDTTTEARAKTEELLPVYRIGCAQAVCS